MTDVTNIVQLMLVPVLLLFSITFLIDMLYSKSKTLLGHNGEKAWSLHLLEVDLDGNQDQARVLGQRFKERRQQKQRSLA